MDDLNIDPVPFLWIEDGKEDEYTPRTRRYNKRKKEMVGWASRQLIHFLRSLGIDTKKPIPQTEISELISKYVTDNKLINPEKRKRVICDERLFALFGRKTIGRVKIYDLLEAHIAENQENSDDDLLSSSDEDYGGKRQKGGTHDRKMPFKMVPQVPKNSLAAISTENIKLVYLKRTLVQELMKDVDSFEVKVLGGFVRIKTDPLDIFQKNSHQLQIVKGVKGLVQADDNSSCTRLHISGPIDEISVSEISDDNFSEEECEDLLKRMKDGLIKQPTVGELEEKVKVLHQDITRHWITKELALLKNLFDRANEKGWRPRAAEYLDKKKLLETPAEQERLLSEIPLVKAEEEKKTEIPQVETEEEKKTEVVIEDPPDNVSYDDEDSPKAVDWDWELTFDSPPKDVITNASTEEAVEAEIPFNSRTNDIPQFVTQQEQAPSKTEPTRSQTNGPVISFKETQTHTPNPKPYQGHIMSFEHKGRNIISFNQNEKPISETLHIPPKTNYSPKFYNQHHQNLSLTLETKDKTNYSPKLSNQHQQNFSMTLETKDRTNYNPKFLNQQQHNLSLTLETKDSTNYNPKFSNQQQQNFSVTLETMDKTNDVPAQVPIKQEPLVKVENVQNKQVQVIDLSDDDDYNDKKPEIPSIKNQVPIPSPRLNPKPEPRPNPSPETKPNPNLRPETKPNPRLELRPNPSSRSGPNPSVGPRPNPISVGPRPNPIKPNPNVVPILEQPMWHYYDPQRAIQGPFSLSSLKRWRDANFFPADFRVWRTGQNPFDAVLLKDLIAQIFSN